MAALGKSSTAWPLLWECWGAGPWRAGPGVWEVVQGPVKGRPASCPAAVKKGGSHACSLGMLCPRPARPCLLPPPLL